MNIHIILFTLVLLLLHFICSLLFICLYFYDVVLLFSYLSLFSCLSVFLLFLFSYRWRSFCLFSSLWSFLHLLVSSGLDAYLWLVFFFFVFLKTRRGVRFISHSCCCCCCCCVLWFGRRARRRFPSLDGDAGLVSVAGLPVAAGRWASPDGVASSFLEREPMRAETDGEVTASWRFSGQR